MAIYEIENENIKLKVDSCGAEMKSLVKKETDTEYLWNGDPAYWQRTSPILFPLVGRLFHNIAPKGIRIPCHSTDLPEIWNLHCLKKRIMKSGFS